MSWAFYGAIGFVGLGLYFMYGKNAQQAQMAPQDNALLKQMVNHPMVPERAHEAMGPALEGNGGIRLDRAYSSRVAQNERNIVRPDLTTINKNQSAVGVVSALQGMVAKVYAKVPRKTDFVLNQARHIPTRQGRVRDHFQVVGHIG